MQDFSSISVSSYEAGVLADRLTEQSKAGWSVVAIVPTGSTVTAYLSRDTGADSGADGVDPGVDTTAEEQVPDEVSVDEIAADEIAVADVAVADVAADASAESQPDLGSTVAEIVPQDVVREAAEGVGWAASADTDTATSNEVAPEIAPSIPEAAAAAPEATVEAEPAAAATEVATAAAGAAPAGWYADPSSRFELRYWDGSQWTEHVSRSGQQYTDPPVA